MPVLSRPVGVFATAIREFARGWPLSIAALLAVGLVLQGPANSTQAQAAPKYPNLKTMPPTELRQDQVDGVGWVLRLSNEVWNAGEGPLELHPDNVGTSTYVWQWVYSTSVASGEPVEKHMVGQMEFHPDHNHWHFENFAKYQLYTAVQWRLTGGKPSWLGEKTSFCVIDTDHVSGSLPAGYEGCSQTSTMGLSAGWGDVYRYYLADQWVVIGASPLPAGSYVLQSIADPLNRLYESANKTGPQDAVADNQGVTCFLVVGRSVRPRSCSRPRSSTSLVPAPAALDYSRLDLVHADEYTILN